MLICNCFHARRANSDKITTIKGVLFFKGGGAMAIENRINV